MRRDLAYNEYLKEHPNGNFARFTKLSQAGKRSYGDPTALTRLPPPAPAGGDPLRRGLESVARVGTAASGPRPSGGAAALPGGGEKELRRKIAWAVGSVYGVKYAGYNTWPAEYARRASGRLVEVHGMP